MRRAPVIALLLVAAGLAAVLPLRAQPRPGAEQQTALSAVAAPLFDQLAELRGIASPGQPPPVLVRSRSDNRRFIQQEMNRRYSKDQLEAERKSMVAWGVLPAEYDLQRLFLDLLEEQVSAYYDPLGKVMVVGDWLPPEQQRAALMHELVHALQDRELSIDAFIAPDPGHGDRLLTRQALIEGEAVALTFDLLLKPQGTDISRLPDLSMTQGLVATSAGGPVIDKAPKFVRDLLLFPYVEGLGFIYQFRKRQPWAAMSAIYKDPPRSTSQILHPEKYFDTREDPLPVTIPDLSRLLPAIQLVSEDDLGEFSLGAVLALHLGDTEGLRAALGWRGDRYRIWEDAAGRFTIAYRVIVAGQQMAAALADQLRASVERRHPKLTGKASVRAGGLVTWSEDGRSFAIERRGTSVVLLEQFPTQALDRARDAVWRARPTSPPR
ncbi:MAG TPA: ImmA/IrrE family metallo-endopeptidase [Candidatus Eisenbacteria bacterium]|nr:ImmA/IrrE family metallo-endopeptidase [Candidatus Eisenbacteria bacterium]